MLAAENCLHLKRKEEKFQKRLSLIDHQRDNRPEIL